MSNTRIEVNGTPEKMSDKMNRLDEARRDIGAGNVLAKEIGSAGEAYIEAGKY